MVGKKRDRGSFLGNEGILLDRAVIFAQLYATSIRHSRRVHLRSAFVLFALSFPRVSVSVIDCWLLFRPGRPFVTRRDRSTTRSSDRDLSSTSTSTIAIYSCWRLVCMCACVRARSLSLRANFDRTAAIRSLNRLAFIWWTSFQMADPPGSKRSGILNETTTKPPVRSVIEGNSRNLNKSMWLETVA